MKTKLFLMLGLFLAFSPFLVYGFTNVSKASADCDREHRDNRGSMQCTVPLGPRQDISRGIPQVYCPPPSVLVPNSTVVVTGYNAYGYPIYNTSPVYNGYAPTGFVNGYQYQYGQNYYTYYNGMYSNYNQSLICMAPTPVPPAVSVPPQVVIIQQPAATPELPVASSVPSAPVVAYPPQTRVGIISPPNTGDGGLLIN